MINRGQRDLHKNAYKGSNGIYYQLETFSLGILQICPLCGEEMQGVTSSEGDNWRICIECSVGEIVGWNFGGWRKMDEEILKKNDETLSEIKYDFASIYLEHPMSEDDKKIYDKIKMNI